MKRNEKRWCAGPLLVLPLLVLTVLFGTNLANAQGSRPPTRKLGPPANAAKWISLFDGRTLSGWQASPREGLGDWSVEDGVLVGKGSANRLNYLVWKEDSLTDFELQLQYRLPADGNTGIEIRALPDQSGKRPLVGYHADLGHVGIGPHILGAWDFHFASRREFPCPRGTHLVIESGDKVTSSRIDAAITLDEIRDRQWNDVRVVADGTEFEFWINGKISSSFKDNHPAALTRGAIALQIHDQGMRVEFKNIRLQRKSGD